MGYFLFFAASLLLFPACLLVSGLTVANYGGIPWLPYASFLGGFSAIIYLKFRNGWSRPPNTSGEAWEITEPILVEEVFRKDDR